MTSSEPTPRAPLIVDDRSRDDKLSNDLNQQGEGVDLEREAIARIVGSAFRKLLAGEYNPALQGFEHRQANKQAALNEATEALLSLHREGGGRNSSAVAGSDAHEGARPEGLSAAGGETP